MTYRVALIGTGANPNERGRQGFSMGYRHAASYAILSDCELIACADLVRANAEQFAAEFGIDDAHVYEDHEEMMHDAEPDIVSVCVPPNAHAEIVVECARTGIPEVIHCEKPMAKTWQECRQMAEVCEQRGTLLTFNHQMRFGAPFREAKSRLDGGAIGDLERIEFADQNLYDSGTHMFDLCNYYADQAPVEWVLAQVDYRRENIWFGAHNENQGLSQWRYENGVYGLASTGDGSGFLNCMLRLVGSRGTVEIGVDDGPPLRIETPERSGWETIETGEDVYGPQPNLVSAGVGKAIRSLPGVSNEYVPAARRALANQLPDAVKSPIIKQTLCDRATADVVRAASEDGTSELSASNALQATELIFASWESVRRRGRVELPLEIDDNPLESMVDAGDLDPTPASE